MSADPFGHLRRATLGNRHAWAGVDAIAQSASLSSFLPSGNAMRIALFQLRAREVEACASTDVPIERIAQLLTMADEQNTDLAVFPEGFPFITSCEVGAVPSLDAAILALQKIPPHSLAYIVGGYVMDGPCQRNACSVPVRRWDCGPADSLAFGRCSPMTESTRATTPTKYTPVH